MLRPFEKKIRGVRLRCSINLLLRRAGHVLVAAGIVALLAVLAEKLLAVSIIGSSTLTGFCAAVIVVILFLWLLRQPSRMQASLLLDERLRLHERFSTTLALADSRDPFADAARSEALKTAERVNLQGHFPIRPSKCWAYAVSTWLVAAALILFMPQKDLLGLLRKDRQDRKRTEQLQQAKVDVKQAANPVKLAVKQLGEPELADALAKLDQAPKDANPEEVKRQAIRQLGDLSDKIQKMQSSTQLESMNLLQKMLRQLHGSADPFSQELRLALAKGNFGQASSLLNQLQKDLAEGKLSPEQQKALSEKLQELGKQLQELARNNEELEKELEKLGLNKELAKLDPQQLREALQKQGLSAEKMEELLQKAAACRSAAGRCAGLGKAMAACGAGGGLSGDELAAAMEQLDGLESLQQQVMLTQATLDRIENAIACLGEGMCDGIGGQGPFREGLANRAGPGTGGPGIGYGPRDSDDTGNTSTRKIRTENKPGEGPVIASWYFKGSQVKGESQRDFSEVVQGAREGAADAISENEIPRKYEESLKKYFGQLEQSGEK